jgi:hypothetical protein
MTWTAILTVLLELFGPFVRKLIEDLLSRAKTELEAEGGVARQTAESNIQTLFDRAKAKTWKVQVVKRRILDAACQVALARAAEVAIACRGGPIPKLTLTEWTTLADAL